VFHCSVIYNFLTDTKRLVATKSSRPWRRSPYTAITRLSDNNEVVSHIHHNYYPMLFKDFLQWEESRYELNLIHILVLKVQGDIEAYKGKAKKLGVRLQVSRGGNSHSL